MVKLMKVFGAAAALVFTTSALGAAQDAAAEQAPITTIEALVGELLAAEGAAEALNAAESSTLSEEQIAFAFGVAAELSGQDETGAIETAYALWLEDMPETVDEDVLAAQFARGGSSASQGTAGGFGSFFGGGVQGNDSGAGTGGGGGASPT